MVQEEKYTRAEEKDNRRKQAEKSCCAGQNLAFSTPSPVVGAKKGLCLKDLLHKKDPTEFPSLCPKSDAQCRFRHGVKLTLAGLHSPLDKIAVLTGIAGINGRPLR